MSITAIADWAAGNWPLLVVPGSVFFAALVAGLWLRRLALRVVEGWCRNATWPAWSIIARAARTPSLLWCLLFAAYLALLVSAVPSGWKRPASLVLLSLLLVSISLAAYQLARGILEHWLDRWKIQDQTTASSVKNVAAGTIGVLALLMLLDIWGVPTTPLVILVGVAAVAAVVAFRNSIPNLIAGLQLGSSGRLKAGDYIALGSGEEGYVVDVGLTQTQIRTAEGKLIAVPNEKLTHGTMVNYGRPLKRAKEPFRFYTRVHLKELTGLKAHNLWELVEHLKTVPESVVYYHTHHFLEEYHFLAPEPANDFAVWVSDVIGDEVLGEALAAVDTFLFSSLDALRGHLAGTIERHLSSGVERRNAAPGREFFFVKSVSLVMPTPYTASDLAEFVRALGKLSTGSLYYHIFESRLRLGRPTNDFSLWLRDHLDENELAVQIAHLDPYNQTLEDLRSTLVQLIEKRIR